MDYTFRLNVKSLTGTRWFVYFICSAPSNSLHTPVVFETSTIDSIQSERKLDSSPRTCIQRDEIFVSKKSTQSLHNISNVVNLRTNHCHILNPLFLQWCWHLHCWSFKHTPPFTLLSFIVFDHNINNQQKSHSSWVIVVYYLENVTHPPQAHTARSLSQRAMKMEHRRKASNTSITGARVKSENITIQSV